MRFVRVPVAGESRSVLMCMHETRERDWSACFGSSDHGTSARACTQVSWQDARRFCDQLTAQERSTGRITARQCYRLPTDHEWSCAAGIGARELRNATPEEKRQRIKELWPWGSTWPPPNNAGNYFGIEAEKLIQEKAIPGFKDGQRTAAVVMSFAPNALGIYDLGGNVWEWCQDEYRPGTDWRVLRGAAWNCSRPEALLSSHRTFDPPNYRSDTVGFRVVLDDR